LSKKEPRKLSGSKGRPKNRITGWEKALVDFQNEEISLMVYQELRSNRGRSSRAGKKSLINQQFISAVDQVYRLFI
jgi:hypothetical protein